MIPGDVTLDFPATLPRLFNGVMRREPTVIEMALRSVDWAHGMSEDALRRRLLACMIPPESPYCEWAEVLSRAAYEVRYAT